jgi:hypothetical protein
MTGIRLALVTHSQPELPRSRPAEERDQTMDVNHLSGDCFTAAASAGKPNSSG